MIAGIGTDIIEIERIKASINRFGESFLKKIFTDNEIRYCHSKANKYQHYAVRFAAKEAIYKAFPTEGQKRLNWQTVEVSIDNQGRPSVKFLKSATELPKMGYEINISLSHSNSYAICVAIVTKN
jgi:holo-[acyl-carrier protein] synthase